jgi:2-polyprenyl-3-methyl-5-hydroxy-6-metoxy-1,4-benzoquinol methylase
MNEPLVWIAILLVLLDVVAVWLLYKGAPFIPTKREGVEKILSLIEKRPGLKVADIGSGDGRILIALAKQGIEAHGFEINPFLVWWSRYKIRQNKLDHLAKTHWQDLWKADLSSFDIVIVFGVVYIMGRLERKLDEELEPGSKVISLGFQFPNWVHKEKHGSIYVYQK